ncbi:MAG: coenzyme A pyrophosphatase [Candidatus Nitrosopolaris wilkensis]|nr:MAG: coenzyme A pyrophosphatase [Candidatus Nitrosopolaris wilkensis]
MLNKEDLYFSLRQILSQWPSQLTSYPPLRMASVLVIIHYTQSSPQILLTKRNSTLKTHKGEIAFPGGAFSKQDKSLCDTAARETREEIGLIIEQKDILGSLQSVRTLTSNFFIIPFVTIQERILEPQILINEVQEVIDAPLFDLLDTQKIDLEHQDMSTKSLYEFTYGNEVIWGATARILKELHDCLCSKRE